MSTAKKEHSFFGFRMFDRNSNEIDLSKFKNRDFIVVVNCLLQDEAEERAAYYISLENKFDKNVQIICVPAARFFYDGHQDNESERLIVFLKKKSNCHNNVDDGLIFFIDNRKHSVSDEVISYIGNNLKVDQLSNEISKRIN